MSEYATKKDLDELEARLSANFDAKLDAKLELFAGQITSMFEKLIGHMDKRFDRIEVRLDRHDTFMRRFSHQLEMIEMRDDGQDAQIARLNRVTGIEPT